MYEAHDECVLQIQDVVIASEDHSREGKLLEILNGVWNLIPAIMEHVDRKTQVETIEYHMETCPSDQVCHEEHLHYRH